MSVAEQGIGLIGHRKAQIGLVLSSVLIGVDHRNAVKKMPRVDHNCRQNGRHDRGPSRQKADPDVLHRSGIDTDAHCRRPDHSVSGVKHKNSKSHSQDNVPRKNGKRLEKSLLDDSLFHTCLFLFNS